MIPRKPRRTARRAPAARPRRLRLAGAVCLLTLALFVACGGSKSECRTETWSGTCQLQGVTKVREVEFPLPNVVLEAIYRPLPSQGELLGLPDVRREFTVLSKHEEAMRQHLATQSSPRCYVNPPPPGQCQPGSMVVEVAEFDATSAQASVDESGPKGCAQIESASAQDKVTQNQGRTEVIPERVQFEEATATLPADAAAVADAVAARLKQNPALQCVGVVGQWVRGESMQIAFERARGMRDLLIARGVEPERLVSLTVSGQIVATSGNPEPPNPKDRRVAFSVLLEIPPKQ